MFYCSLCLDSKNINEFKINKSCGHICICSECFINMASQSDYITSNEKVCCPICRTHGDYMNIYMSDVVRSEEVDRIEEVDRTDEVYTTEEDENNKHLTKLMEYASTSNYTLITLEDSRYLYFNDRNILKSNFVKAYYGTEYSYIDGTPKLVDVTKRLAMALAFNRSHLIIEKKNLINNIYLEQAFSELFTLFVVIRNYDT